MPEIIARPAGKYTAFTSDVNKKKIALRESSREKYSITLFNKELNGGVLYFSDKEGAEIFNRDKDSPFFFIEEVIEGFNEIGEVKEKAVTGSWIKINYDLDLSQNDFSIQDNNLSIVIDPNPQEDKRYIFLIKDKDSYYHWSIPEENSLSIGLHEEGFSARAQKLSLPKFSILDTPEPGIKVNRWILLRIIALPIQWATKKIALKILKKYEEKNAHEGFSQLKTIKDLGPLYEEGNSAFKKFKDWNLIAAQKSDDFSRPDPNNKKSLLFIPGTGGNDEIAFNGITRDPKVHQLLLDHYNERIICFNHKSLFESCNENVDFFIKQIKSTLGDNDLILNVDVLTRSRGGLVLRHLLKEKKKLVENNIYLNVDKVFCIAPPHQGTKLANPENIKDFIDRYTLLLSLIPGAAIQGILNTITAIVIGAANGLRDMPGIQSQTPNTVRTELNRLLPKVYKNIIWASYISNFEPQEKEIFKKFFVKTGDYIADEIFKNNPNDMVNPVKGVKIPNVDPARQFQIDGSVNMHHLAYLTPKKDYDQKLIKLIGLFFTRKKV